MSYFYRLAIPPGHEELVDAEAEILLGGERIGSRCVASDRCVDVDTSAYIHARLSALARSRDLADLLAQIEAAHITADRFKVDVVKYPRQGGIHGHAAMREIGLRIHGEPQLDDPEEFFLLVADGEDLVFGRLEQTTMNDWKLRRHKPYAISAAICPRVARACVNLVLKPGGTLVDACCGSGTIVIEAAVLGMRPVGIDLSPKMAFGTKRNARHFNVAIGVAQGDIRHVAGRFDRLVTNLPYGIYIQYRQSLLPDVALNLKHLAERAVFIINFDMTAILEAGNNEVERVIRLPEGSLTRHIHVVSPRGGRVT